MGSNRTYFESNAYLQRLATLIRSRAGYARPRSSPLPVGPRSLPAGRSSRGRAGVEEPSILPARRRWNEAGSAGRSRWRQAGARPTQPLEAGGTGSVAAGGGRRSSFHRGHSRQALVQTRPREARRRSFRHDRWRKTELMRWRPPEASGVRSRAAAGPSGLRSGPTGRHGVARFDAAGWPGPPVAALRRSPGRDRAAPPDARPRRRGHPSRRQRT